jgi:hypothetical protein
VLLAAGGLSNQEIAEPFEWRFTCANIDALLARLHRQPSFAIEAA